jgi:hypothetical protein
MLFPLAVEPSEISRRIASGDLADVVRKVKQVIDDGQQEPVFIFDDATSAVIDVDFRGTVAEVVERLAGNAVTTTDDQPEQPETPRRPGRPKLGVVAREVTLLPRHWEWLRGQPGGASVALRKLVDEARKANEGKDRIRRAREAAYRFMSAMAGNEPGFEEASRALFRGNRDDFEAQVEPWPLDVREHTKKLASASFV